MELEWYCKGRFKQQGFLAKPETRKLNPKADLNQENSSVLLGHPQLVDTVSSVIQSRLTCCI
jgi:hypothetical protein